MFIVLVSSDDWASHWHFGPFSGELAAEDFAADFHEAGGPRWDTRIDYLRGTTVPDEIAGSGGWRSDASFRSAMGAAS